jgi:hypothetical protein
MRFCVLFLVFACSFNGNSQEVKKKYFGNYAGEIPSYALELGEEVFQVQRAAIEIQLKPEGVLVEKIASKEMKGTYQWIKEDKNGIYFEVRFERQFIPESVFKGNSFRNAWCFKKNINDWSEKGFTPNPMCS